ncbi:MAG: HDOD domain-containing protein [Pseudomonadota bacterium]
MNPPPASGEGGEALAEKVLRRMSEGGGFPALDHSVTRIVDALEKSEDDTAPLVNAVLEDVSLTQKVLRLANSAMYAPIGRSVSTVSHAVNVLGYEAVGHLALGVKVIGSMGRMQGGTRYAQKELGHSLLSGSVAGSVVGRGAVRNGEVGVVCSLLHRTGRLLSAFYLSEEWERVQEAVAAGVEEDQAARQAMGMTPDQLGIQVARHWRLPSRIVHTLPHDEPMPGEEEDAWLMDLTRFSDRSASLLATGEGETDSEASQALAEEYAPRLGLPAETLGEAVRAAVDSASSQPVLAGILLDKDRAPDGGRKATPPPSPVRLLEQGLAELRQGLAGPEGCGDMDNRVVDLAFRILELSRAGVLLRQGDASAYRMVASRVAREPNRLAGLSLAAGPGGGLAHFDLAQIALARQVDIYIDNPRDAKIAAHLPDWVRSHSLHPFFLLPMAMADAKPLGLFYGQQGDDAKLGKDVLAQLAHLRDLLQGWARGG